MGIARAASLLLLLAASCATMPRRGHLEVVEEVRDRRYQGVIVRAVFARPPACHLQSAWTPTRSVIDEFESSLSEHEGLEHVIEPWDHYDGTRRRYLGLAERQTGRKLLRVEFLTAAELSESIAVSDREPRDVLASHEHDRNCRCAALYDPEKKLVIDAGCRGPRCMPTMGCCKPVSNERAIEDERRERPLRVEHNRALAAERALTDHGYPLCP